jgi:hypothetical protein
VNDDQLTAAVQAHFGITLHPYAQMEPIDAWAERDQKLVAYVERKTRNTPHRWYPTAVVDARKWLALLTHEFATGIPALLTYGWEDGVWGWIRPSKAGEVTTRILTPGPESVSLNAGVPRPVIDIPIDAFTLVGA